MSIVTTHPNKIYPINADAIADANSGPASILNVGPDETYPTIADALTVAVPGDEILLEAGYSNESVVITVNNLFVSGTASSKHIDLTLGAGIDTVTLLGHAPIHVHDNSGNNTITGNDGANVIEVTSGIDVAHGGNGVDRLIVDYSNATSSVVGTSVNITDGGSHAVTFDGFENFTILTGSGDDTITTGDGRNILRTHAGNDTITSGDGHNFINAGQGNDTVTAGDGGNYILGDRGNDTITSGAGNDTINGGLGGDTMSGGGGNDLLNGGIGNDTVSGGDGNDDLIGGKGINTLDGGTGSDTADYSLSGRGVTVSLALAGAQAVNAVETDTLTNIENLTGSAFRDTLTGDAGNNVLTGGLGADHLNGGGGSDTLVYGAVNESTSTTHDVITGFDALADRFDLSFAVNGIDSEVSTGHLSNGTFDANLASAIGASQLGVHDAVLFTPTSGSLAGDTFLVVDANGQAGYQAGEDLVFQLDTPTNLASLSTGDFI
jgi:Ca2+-binding RTX toxin-like protein